MKFARNLLLATFVAAVLTLTGCAMLDSLLLAPLRNEAGEKMYVDVVATEALSKEEREAGVVVLVPASMRQANKEYEPAYSDEPSATLGTVGSLAGLIPGPWGALAGLLLVNLVGGGYAAIRGKKKLISMSKLADAWSGLAKHGIKVIEALKSYKWDADADGKISASEVEKGILSVVKGMGKDAADPEFLADVVRALTGSFDESERQAMLERIAKAQAEE